MWVFDKLIPSEQMLCYEVTLKTIADLVLVKRGLECSHDAASTNLMARTLLVRPYQMETAVYVVRLTHTHIYCRVCQFSDPFANN